MKKILLESKGTLEREKITSLFRKILSGKSVLKLKVSSNLNIQLKDQQKASKLMTRSQWEKTQLENL